MAIRTVNSIFASTIAVEAHAQIIPIGLEPNKPKRSVDPLSPKTTRKIAYPTYNKNNLNVKHNCFQNCQFDFFY